MADSWLSNLMDQVEQNSWCVRIGCTTCGAMQFRRGLLHGAAGQLGIEPPRVWSPAIADEVIRGLRGLGRPGLPTPRRVQALRLVFSDLSGTRLLGELVDALNGTWSGEVLQSTRAHADARWQERSRKMEAEAATQAARKRRKEEEQKQRALRKIEIDRSWRANHGGEEP